MEKLLTQEEVAERLAVSPRTVGGWLRDGKLRGVKLAGKMWRIPEPELERFVGSTVAADASGAK